MELQFELLNKENIQLSCYFAVECWRIFTAAPQSIFLKSASHVLERIYAFHVCNLFSNHS